MSTSQAGTDRPAERSPVWPLLPLAIGTFAIGSDLFVLAGILPNVAGDLDVSQPTVGQLVTIFAVAYAIGSPLLATALSGVPRQRLLVSALAVFTLANVGSALAPNYAVLAVMRVVAACGAGLFTPNAAAAAAMSVRPEWRGRALALVFVGLNVANVLGVPLGTAIGSHFDWRATFWFVAGIGAVAVVGVATRLTGLPAPMRTTLAARMRLLGNGRVVTVLLSAVLGSMSGYCFYTYLAPELHAMAGIHQSQLPALLLLNGAVGVVGGQLGGRYADRFSPKTVAGAGFVVLAGTLFLAPVIGQTYGGVCAVLVLFGLSSSIVYVPVQHRLTTLVPSAATEALALNSSALYVGIAGAGVLGGAVLATTTASTIPPAAGACALAALALYSLSYVNRAERPAQILETAATD